MSSFWFQIVYIYLALAESFIVQKFMKQPQHVATVPEKESDEDAGNDDVAEAEHGEVLGLQSVLQQILGRNSN